jgi:hypothetical protein
MHAFYFLLLEPCRELKKARGRVGKDLMLELVILSK